MTWITPDAVFDGQKLRDGLAVQIVGGHIRQVAQPPEGAKRVSGTITPGFVDLQVNGGGGVMLNTTPTPDGLRQIAKAHHGLGTIAILPTVITDHADILTRAADAVINSEDTALLGLHIEGPHIALARRGTHAPEFIRPLDRHTLDVVHRLRAKDVTVMITLAPEAASPEHISQLVAMGTHVSLGHTDATAEQIKAAIAAGARFGTHLFNAMSQMTGRAAGTVGALINSDCHVGIICDGHHVADEMVAIALRARPSPDLTYLVSDAMATVGGPDAFGLYGQTITVQDGKLINADGNLAGAHVTQALGVKRLVDHVGVALEDALRMAITVPATAIGRPELAQLIDRSCADIIRVDAELNCSAFTI